MMRRRAIDDERWQALWPACGRFQPDPPGLATRRAGAGRHWGTSSERARRRGSFRWRSNGSRSALHTRELQGAVTTTQLQCTESDAAALVDGEAH